MKSQTKADIERILEELRRAIIDLLQEGAANAYLFGNLAAYLAMGIRPDERPEGEAEDASIRYAELYKSRLINEGATIINGKKVPWLKDMSAEERSRIYDIIQSGLDEGKATGYTESGVGTYPKDSIAADLQEFFGERKSHASTVARTETGRILNIGTLDRFIAAGVRRVKVLDDEGPNSCDPCIAAHGQEWDIGYAMMNELQHPNCVRAFGPVMD